MTDTTITTGTTPDPAAETATPPAAILCESCGEQPMRYVLADVQERDTSLFCGTCIVLTFAKVANDLFAEQS